MIAGIARAALDLPFTKVTAGGNDFILVDNRNGRLSGDIPALVRAVCHRRLGVGGDGMILVEWSFRADLKMVYFNRDGGEASLCGNGLRCLARWAALRGAAPSPLAVETGAGVLAASGSDDPPWFTLPLPAGAWKAVTLELGARAVEGILVQAGVPHFAFPSPDAFAEGSLDDAPALRSHPALGAEGANVDVYTLRPDGLIDVRYFERGVEAETLSSGTGSMAVGVAAFRSGSGPGPFTCRNREGLETRISLEERPGGALEVTLAAPVDFLYHGRLGRDLLERVARADPS